MALVNVVSCRGKETVESKMGTTVVDLPADCISHIFSFTTPHDACVSSTVCRVFKSAANSDSVWDKFLPSDYKQIIYDSVSISSLITSLSLSKKDLYFHLCYNPIISKKGTTSFALEKESGKKCYMLGARALGIAWGEDSYYWERTFLPESRFLEVAELKEVWWFDVKAKIKTRILSLRTNYAAYLVFKFTNTRYGFTRPVDFGVYFKGSDNGERRKVVLDPSTNMPKLSQDRGDGWMEIEMGEFFNETGEDGTVVCSVFCFERYPKSGIIIQGIELSPKSGI